jgi:NDP-sugar pyrophosphorylase family protein
VTALILAAGSGRRIRSVSKSIPKPLIEIGGAPVLVHNLRLLARHGVKRAWINLHFRPRAIRKAVGTGLKYKVRVSYSDEPRLLGTSGAVRKLARPLGRAPFFVLYGDNYTDCDLRALAALHRRKRAAVTIAGFDPRVNPNSGIAGGRIRASKEGRVIEFVEGRKNARGFVNAGVYAVDPRVLAYIPQGFSDFGKDLFPALLRAGEKICLYRMKGFCLALDTPRAYRTALKAVPS